MITPITPEMVARLNELGRKKKAGSLTEEECKEQAILRRLYIDNIKGQVQVHLDAQQEEQKHTDACSCGCHSKH